MKARIVDDYFLFRVGLCMLIQGIQPRLLLVEVKMPILSMVAAKSGILP